MLYLIGYCDTRTSCYFLSNEGKERYFKYNYDIIGNAISKFKESLFKNNVTIGHYIFLCKYWEDRNSDNFYMINSTEFFDENYYPFKTPVELILAPDTIISSKNVMKVTITAGSIDYKNKEVINTDQYFVKSVNELLYNIQFSVANSRRLMTISVHDFITKEQYRSLSETEFKSITEFDEDCIWISIDDQVYKYQMVENYIGIYEVYKLETINDEKRLIMQEIRFMTIYDYEELLGKGLYLSEEEVSKIINF